MNFSSIETLADLIADSITKGKINFANLLGSLPLTNKTSISGAIEYCIDHERFDLIDLIMLTTYEIGSSKMSSFEYALAEIKFNVAEEMLKRGFDINSIGTYADDIEKRMPPIIFAMWYRNEDEPEALNFVLKHNPNLNIKHGFKEYTPLMFAIGNEEYVFAELLLNAGSDLTIKNKNGRDVFDVCTDREFKKKLFSKLKIVNVGDLIFRETKKGNTDFVKELNELKVDQYVPLKKFILGRIATNNLNIIERLVDDIKEIFKSGYDQYDAIMRCTSSEMLNFLLKQGFDINSRDTAEHTPLINSIFRRNTILAKLLMNAAPNIDLVTARGNTALGVSIMYNMYDITEMLLDAKADVTITNKEGKDALSLCKEYISHNDMARWQTIKDRIEKLIAPQPTESTKIEVYVDENGANPIEIPKIEKIIIRPYWSKDSAPKHHVDYEDRHIEGDILSARRLENGKWIDCNITFPKDNNYIVRVPENSKPEFHVIASASWLSPIQGNLIVRFDDFEYV
jgi:ankyrin repeat protein